jgi:hypothetical protein
MTTPGTLTITNTSLAGYTDEQRARRDRRGARRRDADQRSLSTTPATRSRSTATALAPSYRGLAVVGKAGAFNFDDTHGGKSILYTGGAAAATLRPDATHRAL